MFSSLSDLGANAKSSCEYIKFVTLISTKPFSLLFWKPVPSHCFLSTVTPSTGPESLSDWTTDNNDTGKVRKKINDSGNNSEIVPKSDRGDQVGRRRGLDRPGGLAAGHQAVSHDVNE